MSLWSVRAVMMHDRTLSTGAETNWERAEDEELSLQGVFSPSLFGAVYLSSVSQYCVSGVCLLRWLEKKEMNNGLCALPGKLWLRLLEVRMASYQNLDCPTFVYKPWFASNCIMLSFEQQSHLKFTQCFWSTLPQFSLFFPQECFSAELLQCIYPK